MSLSKVVTYILQWRGSAALDSLYQDALRLGLRGLDESDFECFLRGSPLFVSTTEGSIVWSLTEPATDALLYSKTGGGHSEPLSLQAPYAPLGSNSEVESAATSESAHDDVAHRAAMSDASRPSAQQAKALELYDWQQEALAAWRNAGRRGVIEAVTATGKTRVGIAATIEALEQGSKVLVLVPTKELQDQWRRQLKHFVDPARIGRFGGGHRDMLLNRDVLIGIVNSVRARQLPVRHVGGLLLIADECHRYGSASNKEALDSRFQNRLGLSATYARSDDGNSVILDPYFGGTCFQMGYERAISDRVVSPFKVALVGSRFEPRERAAYLDAASRAQEAKRQLLRRCQLPTEPFGEFMRAVGEIARDDSHPHMLWARAYLKAFAERREVLAETGAKKRAVEGLVPAINAADRTIVFTQTIEGAKEVTQLLAKAGLTAEAIHSELDPEPRRNVLSAFAEGRLRAIVAPQVLDEGVDVPEADLAILVATSGSRRQMIQRMGRVLRRKADSRMARFAVLFVEETTEDPATGAHETFLNEITKVAEQVTLFGAEARATDINDYLCTWQLGRPWEQPNLTPFMPDARKRALPITPLNSAVANTPPYASNDTGAARVESLVEPFASSERRRSRDGALSSGIIRTRCWACGEPVLVGPTGDDTWGLYAASPPSAFHGCAKLTVPSDRLPTASLPADVWATIMEMRAKHVPIRVIGNSAKASTHTNQRNLQKPERGRSAERDRSRDTKQRSPERMHWTDTAPARSIGKCSACGVPVLVVGGVDRCARCMKG